MNKEELTASSFRPLMNTEFKVFVDESPAFDMKLVEVDEKESAEITLNAKKHLNERFSLLFCAPSEPLLSANTYQIEHPEIGKNPMFICPVGQDEDGIYYELIFNRLKRID